MHFLLTTKTRDKLAVAFLIAWHLAFYFPVTLGQQVFSEGDIQWIYLPVRAELSRALAQGRLPLWTPLAQGGLPLFAEGHVAALYPLNLLLHSLVPAHLALSFATLFNVIWISIGMYLFARAGRLRISSSLLAGLALGSSGAVVARISHSDVLTSISWLPWLMFFQVRYWRAKQEGRNPFYWFIACALAIGLQFLAGSQQAALLNLISFVICGSFGNILWANNSASLDRRSVGALFSRRFAEAIFVTVGAVLVGLGLGAIQLLPTAELVGLSVRGKELGRAFFTSYSLDPSALTQFFSPFAFLSSPSADNMELWGYFGILPLMLALISPILRRDFRTWFFVVFALVALSLALGGSNPLYDSLYYVPLLNRFRAPARYLFLFLLASIFLAAVGFDEMQNRLRDAPKAKNVYLVGIPFSLFVTGAAVGAAYAFSLDSWMSAWEWLPALWITLSLGLFALARVRSMNRQILQIIGVSLVCVDLTMFSAPFLSTLARMSPASDWSQSPRTVLAMGRNEPVARSWVMEFPSVSQASIRATLWSATPMIYGRAGIIRGYMPFSLALERNENYIQNMSLAMRNLMGIRYYLLPLEMAPPTSASPFDDAQPVDGLSLELLRSEPAVSPTRVDSLRIISYTDQTAGLSNGFPVGEIDLTFENGSHAVFPIRLGIETADWAYDGIKQVSEVKHSKPAVELSFPAYLRSVGHDFAGHKYAHRWDITGASVPPIVTAIGVRSFLPGAGLTIEHMELFAEPGNTVSASTLLHRNDLALAFRSDTAAMWDNRDAMPRAFIVYTAKAVDDVQALDTMRSAGFDPGHSVLLSDASQADLVSSTPDSASMVEIVDYKSDHAVINVKTEKQGYLVLTDSWYPGWSATVDNKRVPVERADYVFRAVAIPSGEHRVEFDYRPASFLWGALISVAVLLILMVLAALGIAKALFSSRRENQAPGVDNRVYPE